MFFKHNRHLFFYGHFYLKRQKTRKDETAPIYARITVDGKRAEFALKRYLAPKEWNAKRGEVVARRPATRELSTYLEAIRTKLYVCHRQLIDRGTAVTAKSLKDEFFGRSDQGKTLVASFGYHLQKMEERRDTDFAPSTIRKAQTTLKHTRTFLQHQYGVDDMPLKHRLFPLRIKSHPSGIKIRLSEARKITSSF